MDPLVNVVDDFDDAIFDDAVDENETVDILDNSGYADDEDDDDLELIQAIEADLDPPEPEPEQFQEEPPQTPTFVDTPAPIDTPAPTTAPAPETPAPQDAAQILMPPPPPPSATKSRSRKEEPQILGSLMERTTRSATGSRSGLRPKTLKLKLSEKAASKAPSQSFLGFYDRELDTDPEEEGSEMVFEEHFMLRMPPGEDCDKLRKMVANRDVTNDVWFKFKDSRRAIFHIGNNTYSAKLVDLPTIVESQKTWDNKHTFKVADISQMLVVEGRIDPNEEAGSKPFNIDEFIWVHGVTPPLHFARKRRFRKRVNRRTIETVEQEVERLLSEDALATEVQYDVLENVNPDLSDSEFMPKDELEQPEDMGTPLPLGSEAGDAPTPMGGYGDAGPSDEEGSEGSSGDIDEELAAELNQALGGDSASSSGDSEGGGGSDDDNEGRGSDEDEDEEDEFDNAEDKRAKKLLNEEIRDLEAAVEKKSTEIEQSMNPLIRRRFEDALRKLRTDLDLKILQRSQLIDLSRERREAAAAEAELEEGSGSDEDGNGGGRGGKSVDGTSHSHSMGMGVGVSRPMAKAVPPAINAGIREQDEDMEMGDDDDLFGADPAEDGRDMSVGGDEMDVG